ncbi:MAG: hypothetical protein D6721_04930 [Gammaproteobacteria bacterium]|nr:MAG: hypothetical protein D6721_04930 [Gammaproteobacteria bacterium]
MRRLHRKPDILTLLALFVMLGVILTTRAQAGEPAAPAGWQAGLDVMEGVADRLHLRWVRDSLADRRVQGLVAGPGLALNHPAHPGRGELRLHWRAPEAVRQARRDLEALGASATGPRVSRTGLFVTYRLHW